MEKKEKPGGGDVGYDEKKERNSEEPPETFNIGYINARGLTEVKMCDVTEMIMEKKIDMMVKRKHTGGMKRWK